MEKLAKSYNKFQNDFGMSVTCDYKTVIENLFSENLKKIANGKELVGKRNDFETQLNGVKEFAGNWNIEPKSIIPSACNTKCTIRYILNSQNAGKFDIMAVVSSKDGKKIDSIDEVYYQITV